MSETDTTWLTLKAAAQRVGCSTKTLYRRMACGHLPYRVGADNRRYVAEEMLLESVNVRPRTIGQNTCRGVLVLCQEVATLTAAIRRQTQLLEGAISLYQPKTMADLANKQTVSRLIGSHRNRDRNK